MGSAGQQTPKQAYGEFGGGHPEDTAMTGDPGAAAERRSSNNGGVNGMGPTLRAQRCEPQAMLGGMAAGPRVPIQGNEASCRSAGLQVWLYWGDDQVRH